MIGPTFGDEVIAAGLGGLPFSWLPDGTIVGRDRLTAAQNAALDQVIAAHNPAKQPRRLVAKSLIVSRLTDPQLDRALAAMTTRQRERWRSPDHPEVNADDPDVLAILRAIGADLAIVLAP